MSSSSRSTLPRLLGWLAALGGLLVIVSFVARDDSQPETSAPADVTAPEGPRMMGGRTSPKAPAALGPASISGVVRARGGDGLVGAKVCAWASSMRTPACVRSEAGGRYAIEDLAPGLVRLTATAAKHLPAPRGEALTVAAGQRRTGVDLELRPGGVEVSGVVVDELGGPIEGARVWGTQAERRAGGAFTDEQGRFSLWVAPGVWHWHALAPEYAEGRADAAAPGQTIRLTLTPESVIEGRVVEARTQRPLAGIAVTIREGTASGMTFEPATTLARDVSDENGRFRLAGLLPGRYKPIAVGEGMRGEPAASVRLGLAEHVDDLVITMRPSATLVARVVLPGGEGCQDGSVMVRHREGEPFDLGTCGPDGRVTLRGLAPGQYDVVGRCHDHRAAVGSEPIELRASERAEHTITVDAGLELRGTVVDAQGQGVEGVELTVFGGQGATAMLPALSGRDGSFSFRGLDPGSHTIRVSADPHPAPAPLNVELSESTEPLTIELPSALPLEGHVVDEDGQPVAGVRVRAMADLRSTFTRSADDGRFTLALAPGHYGLYATTTDGFEAEEHTVEVPAEKTITVTIPRRGGSITGTVVDEDGQPLMDVWVQARPDDGRRPGFGAAQIRDRGLGGASPRALTDAEGRFELENIGPGPHVVLAQRRGGGEALAEGVKAGADVELSFPRLAALEGTATLPGGEAPGAMIVTLRETTTALERVESFAGAAGHFAFDELPPGHYRISARAIEGQGAIELDLAAGAERDDVVVKLQPRVRISVTVRDLDSDEPLAEVDAAAGARDATISALASEAEKILAMGNRERRSDPRGRLVLLRPPGPSRVLLLHADFERGEYGPHFATLDVPRGVEQAEATLYLVRNRLPKKTRPADHGFTFDGPMFCEGNVVGEVTEGGLAANAGLLAGDEIVAIDGHDIRGRRCYLREWLLRVPADRAVSLTLARGATLDVGGDR